MRDEAREREREKKIKEIDYKLHKIGFITHRPRGQYIVHDVVKLLRSLVNVNNNDTMQLACAEL